MNLQRKFAELNRLYFGRNLPKCRVRWSKKLLRRREAIGDCDSRKREIRIAAELKSLTRVAEMCLLHEMVHLLKDHGNSSLGNDKAYHGPPFQREMLKLAKAGAFRKLW